MLAIKTAVAALALRIRKSATARRALATSLCFPASLLAAKPLAYDKLTLDDRFFAEGVAAGDLNNDGHPDVVAGPFWFAGPDFLQRHEIYPPEPFDPLKYSKNFGAATHDFDGDGWTDVLVYGFPGEDASWYQNPGNTHRAWKRHLVYSEVGNESPTLADLTGDDRPEIICVSQGRFGYAEADWDAPQKPWTFHPISEDRGIGKFTHGLGVGDIDGDGWPDLFDQRGWAKNPGPPKSGALWHDHPAPFAPQRGGAQMHATDLNGDGRADVITSKNAHGYGLSWFEQSGKNVAWTEHVILHELPAENDTEIQFSQLHTIEIGDMDGDGLVDIVTGKRWWAHGPDKDPEPNAPAVVYVFRQIRDASGETRFDPVLVDDDSGAGTQLSLVDLNGDGRLDILTANKKGIFAFLSK